MLAWKSTHWHNHVCIPPDHIGKRSKVHTSLVGSFSCLVSHVLRSPDSPPVFPILLSPSPFQEPAMNGIDQEPEQGKHRNRSTEQPTGEDQASI